jgi:hypothetical protein
MVTSAIIRPLEELLQTGQFDGVVFDTYQPYLELAAMALNVPYVHVANAAPFDVSGDTPLCFFEWKQEPGEDARLRNLQGIDILVDYLAIPGGSPGVHKREESHDRLGGHSIHSIEVSLDHSNARSFDLLPENSQERPPTIPDRL